MTPALHPYPEYKPSGVKWLGDAPGHWEVVRLKGNTANVVDLTREARSDDIYLALEHVESWTGRLNASIDGVAFDSQVKRYRAGDVLFGKLRPYLAKVTCPDRDGVCVGEFLVLRPNVANLSPRYLEQLLRSKPVIDAVDASTFGAKMPRADWQFIGDMRIAIPPLKEQFAIVRCLDYVDRRVRRYVETKRKLIALLVEERQAVIHQAVTRGLDPNVPLKPSGVEWLGDIPANWEVRRVKSLSIVKRGASPRPIEDPRYFDENGEYAWVRIVDVSASSHFLEKTSQRLSKLGQSLSVQMQPGSLFLSIAGSVGKPIITKIKCCIHDGFVYFPQIRGNVDFLYRVFSCKAPFVGLGKLGTQLNLNTETVGDINLGWPPESEQREIVEFLAAATKRIDKAIASTREQIELLEEYRARLIADVVTGKLDVRAAAARLPDEEDEREPEAIGSSPAGAGGALVPAGALE